MTQNGVPRHDSSSSSERYGNRWYDYQNQLKKRYGPGADLLIRMGYVPDARDHTVHANPNHGRRGLGYSPESREGPAFRRGHGPRDANREELQEPLDKCHWNIGEDRFTHEELAAVPYAEEEPLTTLSDDEGLPVPEELEDADFIAMRFRGSRVAGEKKRGRGLANRKMKKAAKLQKKLLAVDKRRERNSAAVSPQAQLYTEFRGSTERILAPARPECISDAGEEDTSRRDGTSKERADKKCFALPHTFYSEWSSTPSQSLVYLYVSCKDRVQQPEEFTKEGASGRPYRGFGTSTTAARATEEHWKSKNFDTLVYYTVASRSSKITDRLLQYEDPAIVFVVAHEALHVHLRMSRVKIPYEYEEALADWVGLQVVRSFSKRYHEIFFTTDEAAEFVQRMERFHALICEALSKGNT
ncbi:hypothetical protein FOZ62_028465 [Perkinsus olseni]|uniref:Uncharacterized protein n=1 Tax=Perkinsus olseni TaxID=32597 RepID=A0A7J6QDA4_PEROL|nr:hypothetical protein FOZ62_028465 [Perkinsus olseni]